MNTDKLIELQQENIRLHKACSDTENEVQQILGKALKYPWFKDDQVNFPGSTEKDGVCVGEQVAATLAMEAAEKITESQARIKELEMTLKTILDKTVVARVSFPVEYKDNSMFPVQEAKDALVEIQNLIIKVMPDLT